MRDETPLAAPPVAAAGQPGYDLFLSYNSRDRAEVEAVRRLLLERNVSAFFDRHDLMLGSMWFDDLQSAIRESRAVAVFIGPAGLGTWQKREMALAIDRQASADRDGHSFPVIPVLLPRSDIGQAPGLLLLNTWLDLRGRLDEPAALDALAQALLGADAMPRPASSTPPLPPYRDLRSFREEDAPLFFGREVFARELLEKTKACDLVAVVGPSGSGKSSVVQAGLLPLLRRQPPPFSGWDAITFTPGVNPFHNLALPFVSLLDKGENRTDLVINAGRLGDQWAGGTPLVVAVKDALDASRGTTDKLLIIADQFEELFTLTPEGLRRPFLDALLDASALGEVTLLLTLRADFYGQAVGFSRQLSDLMQRGLVNLGPMKREELQLVIEEPARHVGLGFEAGLVKRLLDHVVEQPGSLPLLEFALTELWLKRQGGMMMNQHYDEIGGVEGAISKSADAQFERLPAAEGEVLLRFLTRLVRVSAADEEGTDTRQRVSLKGVDETTAAAVESFVRARLLVKGRQERTDEETVEVAHEALIRKWGRLRQLLDKDRAFLLWRQRLRLRLDEYERTDRDAGALLSGALLTEARKFLHERSEDLHADEREYIAASDRAQREREQAERAGSRLNFWAKIAAASLLLAALGYVGWRAWEASDSNQIRLIKDAAAARLRLARRPEALKEWLVALALSGDGDRLRDAVMHVPEPRSQALAGVATALHKAGEIEAARHMAELALKAVRRVEEENDPKARFSAYTSVAELLLELGDKERAGQFAIEGLKAFKQALDEGSTREGGGGDNFDNNPNRRNVEGSLFSRDYDLTDVIRVLLRAGRIDDARAIMDEVKDQSLYSSACLELIELKMLDEAKTLSDSITHETLKLRVLASLARELKRSNRGEEATRIADESYRFAEAAPAEMRVLTLAGASEVFIEIDDQARARQAAQKAYSAAKGHSSSRAERAFLRAAAVALAKTGLPDEALAAIRESSALGTYPNFTAYFLVVEALEKTGRHDEARRVVVDALAQREFIHLTTPQPQTLLSFLKIVLELDGLDRAILLIQQLDPQPGSYILLARMLLGERRLPEALKVGRNVITAIPPESTVEELSSHLRRAADLYVEAGAADEFLRAARDGFEGFEPGKVYAVRPLMLSALAESLAVAGKEEEAQLALTEAAFWATSEGERAVPSDPDRKPLVLSRLARVQARLGHFRSAVETAKDSSLDDKLGVYAIAVVKYADRGDGKLLGTFDRALRERDETSEEEEE